MQNGVVPGSTDICLRTWVLRKWQNIALNTKRENFVKAPFDICSDATLIGRKKQWRQWWTGSTSHYSGICNQIFNCSFVDRPVTAGQCTVLSFLFLILGHLSEERRFWMESCSSRSYLARMLPQRTSIPFFFYSHLIHVCNLSSFPPFNCISKRDLRRNLPIQFFPKTVGTITQLL